MQLLPYNNNGSLSLCDFHREESERVNHILLVTILNPMYPITTVSLMNVLQLLFLSSSIQCTLP